MRRFTLNRSWTLIPALLFSLAFTTVTADPSVAMTYAFDDNGGIKDGGGPANPQAGDPDLPGGTFKPDPDRSAAGRLSATTFGVRTAGDSRTTESVVMWRVQVALRGVWKIYFRF